MRVLWVATVEAVDIEIMAQMERGTRVETTMTGCVPCITNFEDDTKPCWAWIPYWMDIGAYHIATG